MIITLKLMIITPYHSQAHIISCNSTKVGCLFLGLVVVFYLITTLLPSITHSLTHQQQVLVLGLGFFVCWVFFFCLVLFVITATSKQARKQNKQASKEVKQTSQQANKQVIKQSNSTAASKLSSTEPITRFFFYPFSSLPCSVPDFCEDLSKPHFS
jgi:large-conductance mechanosensitive channel